MSVEDLSEVLEDANMAEGAHFIDVREPHEEKFASLPRFHLMPLSRWAGCLGGNSCSVTLCASQLMQSCILTFCRRPLLAEQPL